VHDAAPDLEVHALDDLDGVVGVVLRHQADAPLLYAEALDAQLVVDAGDDDVSVVGLDRAVHDEDRAGADADARHRVARDAHVEGLDRVLDQVAVEVEPPLYVMWNIGRRISSRLISFR
jgi:hypothetical protein